MALVFVMIAFVAIVASGLDDSLYVSDHTSLLQTSMSVESRKVQRGSSSSFGEALATCPSMSAVDMDGISCTSATSGEARGVHIKSLQTHETIKAAPFEDQSAPVAAKSTESQEATISVLRCILNLVTFVFVIDTLRRLASTKGSAAVEEANTGLPDTHTMLRAVERNDIAAVKAMLDQGMSLYAEDSAGRTVLHAATKSGAVAVVNLLLQRGAKVDVTDSWDETPLHHAARAGAIDICKSLLANGAKIDAPNAQDWTPLVAAASCGQKEACEWLMARGATQDGLPEALLPSLLQQLLKADEPEVPEPEFQIPDLEAKLEADLLRRALEPKPEWEEVESLPEWVAAVDDYDA